MSGTTPKPFVFVLMPFDTAFDDVYKLGIKAACQEAGTYCARVDEQMFHESMLERIYNQISKADIIVADMTGRNANVFYETGYAHALGKRTILLTQNVSDIPFDLMHYPHIIYEKSVTRLKKELKARVRHFARYPDERQLGFPSVLKHYINGIELVKNAFVPGWGVPNPNQLLLNYDLKNSSNTLVNIGRTRFAIVFPDRLLFVGDQSSVIDLGKRDRFVMCTQRSELLPQEISRAGAYFELADSPACREQARVFECALRIFTEIGMTEIPFKLQWPAATSAE